MLTLKELSRKKGRVYIYLEDDETCRRFIDEAEREGFTFCDGAAPSSREHSTFYALNPDLTINFIGFSGRIAYACADKIGNQKLIKYDYKKGCIV